MKFTKNQAQVKRFIKDILMLLITIRRFKQLNFPYPRDAEFRTQAQEHINSLRPFYFKYLHAVEVYDAMTIMDIERACEVDNHAENLRFIMNQFSDLSKLDTRVLEQILSVFSYSVYEKPGFKVECEDFYEQN